MLKELELSLAVLNEVIDEKTSFAEALRKRFQADVEIRPMRGAVAALVGCELRHQLYFDYMMKGLEGFDANQKRFLALYLANAYYAKRFEIAQVEPSLEEVLSQEQIAAAKPLLDLIGEKDHLIPEEVERNSPLYLQLRYNIPEWALKILRHFSTSQTYKTLGKFGRPSTTTLRVRTSALEQAKLLENQDFKATEVEGIVSYVGKAPLRKMAEYRDGRLFEERPLTKIIIDENRVENPGEIFLYNGNADSSLEKELIESYGALVGLNLGVPSTDAKVDVTRLIKGKNLSNVNFFAANDFFGFQAAISKPQDLVIAAPNSTNFDLIPSAPDYLLNFNTDGMDALIEQEKTVLENASKFVDVGGKLIYLIYTLSKKEGPQMVANFLKVHPEFELVSERQYFPFEKEETAAYVAVMTKKENELTIAPPLGDLSSITPSTSAGAVASGKQ